MFAAYISTGQIMGWGHKAIEIRAVETGHLDGVFMHKKAQKLKFLCERNDKVYSHSSCDYITLHAKFIEHCCTKSARGTDKMLTVTGHTLA